MDRAGGFHAELVRRTGPRSSVARIVDPDRGVVDGWPAWRDYVDDKGPGMIAPDSFYPNTWIKIEIVSVMPERVEVTVTQTGDDPLLTSCIDIMLKQIAKCWPTVHVKIGQSSTEQPTQYHAHGKRGGPIGTPEPRRLEIVRGWLAAQGQMNQEVYAQSRGVATSTLRRWMHELRAVGKL